MSQRRQNQRPPRSRRPQTLSWGGLVLTLLALLIWWWRGGLPTSPGQPVVGPTVGETSQATPVSTTASATATAMPTAAAARSPTALSQPVPAVGVSGLPTIRYEELPAEAHETIRLIDQDGPFPFERDGVTFQNRERLLPQQPRGYYREFTVITPGEDDRGARRIVTGEAGELYYTDDHYASFQEVLR
jgi:ribonuclease T1